MEEPWFFIDEETNKPLAVEPIEFKIKIGAQFTESEYKLMVSQAEKAASVGVALSIWQLVIIFLFKKVLFSMWILILTMQFFVYLALWQVRYPYTVHLLLF